MTNDPSSSPRWPHLIGKGILYQGDQMSKHQQLVADLWMLWKKLDTEAMPGEDVLDPREDIADEIWRMLHAAGEEPPSVRERTQK